MSQQPWSAHITIEEVTDIHAQSIARFGGDPTPKAKDGCIEKSLAAAWNAELYSEPDSGGLCFAGSTLFYLAMNHCFIDGNKRVAWACCVEILRKMGLSLETNDEEAESFCLSLIGHSGDITKAVEVANWLEPRLIALP